MCPETVRRYLEKNCEQSGYKRGSVNQLKSIKKPDVVSSKKDNTVGFNENKTTRKSKHGIKRKNPSPDIDLVCSRLELMMQQEDNLRTTLLESDSHDMQHPNQTVVMQQLMEEIKNIHGQLAEFRQELGSLQSSVKKNEENDWFYW